MEIKLVDIDRLRAENRPIVIWGAKNAGLICYRLLSKLNVAIAAIGDNNNAYAGRRLHSVPILSLQEILSLYPNAFIVVGSFFRNVSEYIIRQLQAANKCFAYCCFEQIEYLYELEYLDRKIRNKDKLFRIFNKIRCDKNEPWKQEFDQGIMEEYRYVLHDDKSEDLKRHLLKICGIKNLVLIAGGDFSNVLERLFDELEEFDNIGHIILAINCHNPIEKKILCKLSEKVFYVICDKSASREFLDGLCEAGIIVETREIPDELFGNRAEDAQIAVTEDMIVKSIRNYIDNQSDNMQISNSLSSKPVYIVQLFNGLANQTLMYLFGRFIEEESERIVVFDDTILSLDVTDEEENIRRINRWTNDISLEDTRIGVEETRKRNSFYHFKRAELAEVFDIPIRLLSDYFDELIWNTYLEKVKREHSHKYAQSFPLCHVLLENNINVEIVRDSLLPKEFLAVNSCCCIDAYTWGKPYGQYSVTDFILHSNENFYFMGGWSDGRIEDWLLHNRQWVRNQLTFRLDMNDRNKKYAEMIEHSDGVMVHVRRGDFSYYKKSAGTEYFYKSIQAVEKMNAYNNKKYFIFSDDMEWCIEHTRELGIDVISNKVIFVSGNVDADSYIDMYLISLGKIMIPTPGSTFGYVSMLLSTTMERCIDVQKYLYDLQYGLPVRTELREISVSELHRGVVYGRKNEECI